MPSRRPGITGLGARSVRAARRTDMLPDAVAATYLRVLLDHTRWSETQWDEAQGHYRTKDFGFAVVLGNAVLLTHGTYDATRAGIDRETLARAHARHHPPLRRVQPAHGRHRVGPHALLRHHLPVVLRARRPAAVGRARRRRRGRTSTPSSANRPRTPPSLGSGDDPASGSWTPNGLEGGLRRRHQAGGDGRLRAVPRPGARVGATTTPRRPTGPRGTAAGAATRRGCRPRTSANPARRRRRRRSPTNTARNLYDTFIVENHGSFGPHYQEELWRTSGRNAAHFLAAGRPLPAGARHGSRTPSRCGARCWA